MKQHGIIMTGPSIPALAEGRKTQTRRIIKPQPTLSADGKRWQWKGRELGLDRPITWLLDPYSACRYAVGDLLYAKEAYQIESVYGRGCPRNTRGVRVTYAADGSKAVCCLTHKEYTKLAQRRDPYRKTSGRFMYKSLARYWLEVTAVGVERLQSISEADAIAEGIQRFVYGEEWGPEHVSVGYGTERLALSVMASTGQDGFRRLWDSLHAKDFPWESNPWVWVITFEQIDKPGKDTP